MRMDQSELFISDFCCQSTRLYLKVCFLRAKPLFLRSFQVLLFSYPESWRRFYVRTVSFKLFFYLDYPEGRVLSRMFSLWPKQLTMKRLFFSTARAAFSLSFALESFIHKLFYMVTWTNILNQVSVQNNIRVWSFAPFLNPDIVQQDKVWPSVLFLVKKFLCFSVYSFGKLSTFSRNISDIFEWCLLNGSYVPFFLLEATKACKSTQLAIQRLVPYYFSFLRSSSILQHHTRSQSRATKTN